MDVIDHYVLFTTSEEEEEERTVGAVPYKLLLLNFVFCGLPFHLDSFALLVTCCEDKDFGIDLN